MILIATNEAERAIEAQQAAAEQRAARLLELRLRGKSVAVRLVRVRQPVSTGSRE